MGNSGVAWATFLCQGVSCVLAMVVVFRRIGAFKSTHKVVLFSWNMLGKVAMVAIPSILQQSFVSVGNIILQSVINTFGASVIAGYSAAVKLNNMVITSSYYKRVVFIDRSPAVCYTVWDAVDW